MITYTLNKRLHGLSNLTLLMILFAGMFLISCDEDEENEPMNEPTGNMEEFMLHSVSDPSISGTVTFEELEGDETKITIDLEGTVSESSHPAHIHMNTAAEGGNIAVSLNPVDGESGMSETIVSEKDDGSPVSYDQLINFDGYVNVHLSADDLATLVAQGDIGQNALTGMSETYTLNEEAVEGISGTATFHERMNGETLIVVALMGPVSGDHPMHIHEGSVADAPGDILITLNDVNSEGISKTNVVAYDNMDMISYDQLIGIDGYINVHSSLEDLATLIAQGNVGGNAD